MYKGLIICDNDGTLLPFGESAVEPSIIETLKRCMEQGYLVCIASGRSYSSLAALYESVMEDIVFACNNGAEIIYKGERIMEPVFITTVQTQELCDYFLEKKLFFTIATRDRIYAISKLPDIIEELYGRSNIKIVYRNSVEEIEDDILQLAIYDIRDFDELITNLSNKWDGAFNFFPSGPGMLDITPNNKGDAMIRVADFFGIDRKETYAFGDSHNDMPMLKMAGHGYLMDCAEAGLKDLFPQSCNSVGEVLGGLLI